MTIKQAYELAEKMVEEILDYPDYQEDEENPRFKLVNAYMKKMEKLEKGAEKHGWDANSLFVKMD